jgi:hypothetical protein
MISFSESTWLLLDRIGIICGILAFLGTAYSAFRWWRHQQRERQLQQPVTVRLVAKKDGRLLLELPYKPARGTVSRAEVLGLLGMIPSRQQRFDWQWGFEPQFMQDIEEIYRGDRDVLEIPLSDAEFRQLEVPPPV